MDFYEIWNYGLVHTWTLWTGQRWIEVKHNPKYLRSQWPKGLRRGSETDRFLAGIESSNLAGGIVASCECCVLRYTSLWWADPSSRRVLPTVVCDLETSKIIVWRYRCKKSCHTTSYKHFSEHITSPSYNSQFPGCWNINGTSETHPITCRVTECKSVMSHPTSSVHFNVDECSSDL